MDDMTRAQLDIVAAEKEWASLTSCEKSIKALQAVRDLPSERDLMTNAVARAMYEYALRGLEEGQP